MKHFEHASLQPLNYMLAAGSCDVELKYFVDNAPYVQLSAQDNANLLALYDGVRNCCPRCYETVKALKNAYQENTQLYAKILALYQLNDYMSRKDTQVFQLLSKNQIISRGADGVIANVAALVAGMYAQQTTYYAQFAAEVDKAVWKAAKLAAKCEELRHSVALAQYRRYDEECQRLAQSYQVMAESDSRLREASNQLYQIADLQDYNAYLKADNLALKTQLYRDAEQFGKMLSGSYALARSGNQEVADLRTQCYELLDKSRLKGQKIEVLSNRIRKLESYLAESCYYPVPMQCKSELVLVQPHSKPSPVLLQRSQLLKIQVANLRKQISGLREYAIFTDKSLFDRLAKETLAATVSYCVRK